MSLIEPQRKLLGDAVRNRAFAEAIRRSVVRGRTRVAELGAGTGYLSILAEKAGAVSVWACEGVDGLAALAQSVAKANRCRQVRVVAGHSTGVAPPGQVDLLIAEILGNIAGEEHLVDAVHDAGRWLAPGATVIPSAVEQVLCPVVGPQHQEAVDVLAAADGVDLAEVRRLVLNNLYVRRIAAEDCLGGATAAQVVDRMTFPGCRPGPRKGRASWDLTGGVGIHGLALWWRAQLAPGVVLATGPLDPPTHWDQVYLPLDRVLQTRPGDRLVAELTVDAGFAKGCAVAWKVRLERAGRTIASVKLDNVAGFI